MNRIRYRWRWDTPEKYQTNLRNYLRMLAGMDRNIGRMVETLERQGRMDETVIMQHDVTCKARQQTQPMLNFDVCSSFFNGY